MVMVDEIALGSLKFKRGMYQAIWLKRISEMRHIYCTIQNRRRGGKGLVGEWVCVHCRRYLSSLGDRQEEEGGKGERGECIL